MKVFQSRKFSHKVKKFNKSEKSELDKIIKRILKNHQLGVEKKGDLKGIFIYKFKIKSVEYLLAYRIKQENLELIMIGVHENYYRELKSYIKN
ncbi:MAG: addiction module toxin RelE [Desulfuromonas sp. SDB]|nr:MAG: addiction module toxin RelE [Desulfuromonas sp. SDB]